MLFNTLRSIPMKLPVYKYLLVFPFPLLHRADLLTTYLIREQCFPAAPVKKLIL